MNDRSQKRWIHHCLQMVPWVVVTLGADGAIVKHGDNIYRAKAPKIEAVNPVGSGDSVVAGFAAGFARRFSGRGFD